jgi:D-arabinose 1-dehydrogenase-like Zn-dependent alcohol dehydrogenase
MDFFCENGRQFLRDDTDQGSFGSQVVWDQNALFHIPDELDSASAAPLMCGGVTVFGGECTVFGLTNSGIAMALYGLRSTHRVGIIGIGGLGHLAIQFASKMGCQVVAFSGTESKRAEAMGFGAVEFHATRGLTEFKGVKPLDQLLITTSEQPDFGLYLQCSPCPCFLAPPSVLNSLLVLRLIGGEGI